MSNSHFNASSEYCNATLQSFVYNLTSSYADQRNEATMVATSVVMFALAALFFNLNIFSSLSDVSAILNPSVRLFLSASLSLFLPVMSYLFSEAKNQGAAAGAITASVQQQGQMAELSLRARVILMWMLLVELLRKKVEAILVVGVPGYSGTIERSARIAWLGYLVFYNLRSAGKKALYGILWVLAAAKLVQRFVTLELAKRSFAYGKNPMLVTSYMSQILVKEEEEQQVDGNGVVGSELMKRCNYVVAGEENLEKKAGPNGYDLGQHQAEAGGLMEAITRNDDDHSTKPKVITVGKIWKLDETDMLLQSDPRLKRLCLSLALFKLLRRRLEDFPITDAETRSCHKLVFKGLCQEGSDDDNNTANPAAAALFQVFNDEVQFLCEYYHSVHPVVLASPFFFVANYILFPLVVWALCILTIILCSHGDVGYAFYSFTADNYAISLGLMKVTGCILSNVRRSPQNLFSTVDTSITILLFVSFAYEEVWEFVVFLLSNWFMVSLLCSYTSDPRWRESRALSGIIRGILWARNMLSQHSGVSLKQHSLLWFYRPSSSALPTTAVPIEAKRAIMDRLASAAATPLSNGRSVLQQQQSGSDEEGLSWACDSDSIAEVILTWHIATALLEANHPLPKQSKPGGNRKVATALSRYCAYLVAFHPELLPDAKDGTERVYRETKEELKKEMGCLWYYCSGVDARSRKLMEMLQGQAGREATMTTTTALRKGAKLGKALMDRHEAAAAAADGVWKLLADVWTEVVTYAAPTSSELHVKAHKEALAHGGEFITVLWALTTHTGIARGPAAVATPPPPAFV